MSVSSTVFIGLDVSKSELVVSYRLEGKWKKCKICNEVPAILNWLEQVDISDKHFVLESTGPYSERLIHSLGQAGASFSVINPLQSRAMSKALMKSNKTDDQDAQTLCLLGEKMELKTYKMPSPSQKKRKEAFSALTSLQKQEQQLQNQLHAFEYRVNPNPIAVQALKDVLASTQEAIQILEKELNPDQDEEQDQQLINLIASIKGVGIKTAKAFSTLFGNFQDFSSAKAFAKFIGLAPTEFTSGATVRGRRSINKNGSAKARALLFNCARSAIQHNPICKQLYDKIIQKGKNGKVALTAVMHKIARIIFGVAKSRTPYNPQFALLKTKSS